MKTQDQTTKAASACSQQADKWIDACAESEDIAGYVRVTKGGHILYARGFGYADREHHVPVTADTVFSFYSLSKPFCAIALMKLWDRGLVSLEAHPSAYVPEAGGLDPRVTVRQVLTHTSGLPDFLLDGIRSDTGKTPISPAQMREGIAALARYPQVFVPGTDARYSNVNFNLCALITENVSGMRYADYMAQEVFAPLGMNTARVDDVDLTVPRRAVGYSKKDGVILPVCKVHQWMFGAGDLIGTADDVYCLHDAITERKLLSEAAWREILTPSPINHMGFGCTVYPWQGQTRINHNGGYTGFRTFHVMFPDQNLDFILLFNQDFTDPRERFTEKLYEIYGNEAHGESWVAEPDKGYI